MPPAMLGADGGGGAEGGGSGASDDEMEDLDDDASGTEEEGDSEFEDEEDADEQGAAWLGHWVAEEFGADLELEGAMGGGGGGPGDEQQRSLAGGQYRLPKAVVKVRASERALGVCVGGRGGGGGSGRAWLGGWADGGHLQLAMCGAYRERAPRPPPLTHPPHTHTHALCPPHAAADAHARQPHDKQALQAAYPAHAPGWVQRAGGQAHQPGERGRASEGVGRRRERQGRGAWVLL